jgi:hypothetical protein
VRELLGIEAGQSVHHGAEVHAPRAADRGCDPVHREIAQVLKSRCRGAAGGCLVHGVGEEKPAVVRQHRDGFGHLTETPLQIPVGHPDPETRLSGGNHRYPNHGSASFRRRRPACHIGWVCPVSDMTDRNREV